MYNNRLKQLMEQSEGESLSSSEVKSIPGAKIIENVLASFAIIIIALLTCLAFAVFVIIAFVMTLIEFIVLLFEVLFPEQ